jgi:DNA (cytosine-5)-methyltransferase 1
VAESEPGGRDIPAIMRKVRSTNTTPELRFREALAARGVPFAVDVAGLPGKPDVALTEAPVAVFIDGDYWHGGQWRRRRLAALEEQFPATASRAYWLRKIRRNMERDCESAAALLAQGWTALRLWESAIRADVEACVEMTLAAARTPPAPDAFGRLPQKTVAEFFAGIGLMRLGLDRQGWTTAFANDIDPQKHAMYRGHFGDDPHFVPADIHALPVERVPTVTLATASFPCNDLSLAGGRQGLAGRHSSAFWGFIRILEEMGARRPPLTLIENVTGFLTAHGGADFHAALGALNRLGYQVDAFILDAARFTPQSRQRLFVVGTQAAAEGAWRVDPLGPSATRPPALVDFIRAHQDIAWAVRGLPEPPESGPRLESILEDLPDDAPAWWSPARATYLLNQMSPRHRALADAMIAGEEDRYGAVFRRMRGGRSMAELRVDGRAGCLRTPRGGSGRQILVKAGRGRFAARLITAREAARLQGADDYRIEATLNQALFGFGDAVCVPVIAWIAEYYLNPLVNELIHGRPLRLPAAPGR